MNKHYKNRYDKLIQYRLDNHPGEGEIHHIIPKCMGGSDDPDNLVKLSYREHYIAHYMLAKAYPEEPKLWFAFNMMRRVCEGKSILYESARKYISKVISKCNSGRPMSEENRLLMSLATANTVVVKDSKGNRFRVNKDDPRYKSGELKSYRHGYKHTEKTKQKMIENGLSGRKMCYNEKTGRYQYLYPQEKLPQGFKWGSPPQLSQRASQAVSKLKWWTNVYTGKCKRLPDNEAPDGDGWVKGRKNMKRGKDGKIIKP